jgi:hypothetical protein
MRANVSKPTMNLFFIEKEMILLIIPFIKLFHMDGEEVKKP